MLGTGTLVPRRAESTQFSRVPTDDVSEGRDRRHSGPTSWLSTIREKIIDNKRVFAGLLTVVLVFFVVQQSVGSMYSHSTHQIVKDDSMRPQKFAPGRVRFPIHPKQPKESKEPPNLIPDETGNVDIVGTTLAPEKEVTTTEVEEIDNTENEKSGNSQTAANSHNVTHEPTAVNGNGAIEQTPVPEPTPTTTEKQKGEATEKPIKAAKTSVEKKKDTTVAENMKKITAIDFSKLQSFGKVNSSSLDAVLKYWMADGIHSLQQLRTGAFHSTHRPEALVNDQEFHHDALLHSAAVALSGSSVADYKKYAGAGDVLGSALVQSRLIDWAHWYPSWVSVMSTSRRVEATGLSNAERAEGGLFFKDLLDIHYEAVAKLHENSNEEWVKANLDKMTYPSYVSRSDSPFGRYLGQPSSLHMDTASTFAQFPTKAEEYASYIGVVKRAFEEKTIEFIFPENATLMRATIIEFQQSLHDAGLSVNGKEGGFVKPRNLKNKGLRFIEAMQILDDSSDSGDDAAEHNVEAETDDAVTDAANTAEDVTETVTEEIVVEVNEDVQEEKQQQEQEQMQEEVVEKNQVGADDAVEDVVDAAVDAAVEDAGFDFAENAEEDKEEVVGEGVVNEQVVDGGDNGQDTGRRRRRRRRLKGVQWENVPRVADVNGIVGDWTQAMRNKSSPAIGEGEKGRFSRDATSSLWRTTSRCWNLKGCTVAPQWRLFRKSAPMTCDDITEHLMPKVVDCLRKDKHKCSLWLDSGYFRHVLSLDIPLSLLWNRPRGIQQKWSLLFDANDLSIALDDSFNATEWTTPVVMKVMKDEFWDHEADWLRHFRESVLLQRLSDWDEELTAAHFASKGNGNDNPDDVLWTDGSQFFAEYSLTNTRTGESGVLKTTRTLHFVPEWGHCLEPSFLSISPMYPQSLAWFIDSGQSWNTTLSETLRMATHVASGLQALHGIRGGPFAHTDIQPRQFMVDSGNNVFINDFNRGKLMPRHYLDPEIVAQSKGKLPAYLPCTLCSGYSNGHWRAPQEYGSQPLTESLDVYSTALVIWSLFSGERPFPKMSHKQVRQSYDRLHVRPPMSEAMPGILKQTIERCLDRRSNKRLTAHQLAKEMQYIYYYLKRFSGDKMDSTLQQLLEAKEYKDANYAPGNYLAG